MSGESLLDRVNARFAEKNHEWISRLFKGYSRNTGRLITPDDDVGHEYIFTDVILNTRLGRKESMHTPQGPKCGDNGGRTLAGKPCKRKAVTNGRCSQHPPALFHVNYRMGDQIPRVTIRIGKDGNDTKIRPLPAIVDWEDMTLFEDEGAELMPIDLRGTFQHVSNTLLWNKIILDFKSILRLPPEMSVVVDGVEYGADRLWDIAMLRDSCALPYDVPLVLDGQVLPASGFLLEDLGIRSGSALVTC